MSKFKIGLSLRYKLLALLITIPLVSLGLYLLMATDLFQKDKVAYVFDSSATVSRSLATQARMEINASYASYRAIVENFDFTAGDFNQAGKDLFGKSPRAQALGRIRAGRARAARRFAEGSCRLSATAIRARGPPIPQTARYRVARW